MARPITRQPGARVLVTGSQGFVGRHLRRALVLRGCECVGVDRPGSGAEHELDLSERTFDPEALLDRAGPIDALIEMAADIRRGSSVDAEARANLRTIAEAALRLAEAWAARAPAHPHVVYCSSFKLYGPMPGAVIDPGDPPPLRPDPHSYGSAKALAERFLEIAAPRAGLTLTFLRSTCIYGPAQHPHNAIPLFLRAALRGESPVVFGDGGSVRDDVFVADLAWLLAEAALRRVPGRFHGAGERARTILEVARACVAEAHAAGGPLVPVTVDTSRPAKWWLDQRFDLAATRSAFGYEPTPLAAGLAVQAAWMRDGGTPETAADVALEATVARA